MLTWENPPAADQPAVPTREEIAQALTENRGKWAVVARHDRAARAERMAERITGGAEYGGGFVAVYRVVGNEHRVYARRNR